MIAPAPNPYESQSNPAPTEQGSNQWIPALLMGGIPFAPEFIRNNLWQTPMLLIPALLCYALSVVIIQYLLCNSEKAPNAPQRVCATAVIQKPSEVRRRTFGREGQRRF